MKAVEVMRRVADQPEEQQRAKQSILLELNGRVHEAAKRFESADREPYLWDFTCECGAPDCRVSVSLTLAEYEVLRDVDRPVLAVGHDHPAAKARKEPQNLRSDAAALKGQVKL